MFGVPACDSTHSAFTTSIKIGANLHGINRPHPKFNPNNSSGSRPSGGGSTACPLPSAPGQREGIQGSGTRRNDPHGRTGDIETTSLALLIDLQPGDQPQKHCGGSCSSKERTGAEGRAGGAGSNRAALTCSSFPSAGVTSATFANSPSSMMGSTLRGMTLMMAFCAAALSDSTAAASTSPVWPSPACRVAMSSQGQRTASCSWGPALMLPAAAAGSGHTYRSGTRPHPAAGSGRRQSLAGLGASGTSTGEQGERGGNGARRAPALLSARRLRSSPLPLRTLGATCSGAAGSSKAYFKQTTREKKERSSATSPSSSR